MLFKTLGGLCRYRQVCRDGLSAAVLCARSIAPVMTQFGLSDLTQDGTSCPVRTPSLALHDISWQSGLSPRTRMWLKYRR